MTKIPGTLDQCLKQWAPGFPGTYFHMIHKYPKWAEVANDNIEKKTLGTRNQNLWGSTTGGQRSRIERHPHSRTLGFIPRGVGILDTS